MQSTGGVVDGNPFGTFAPHGLDLNKITVCAICLNVTHNPIDIHADGASFCCVDWDFNLDLWNTFFTGVHCKRTCDSNSLA